MKQIDRKKLGQLLSAAMEQLAAGERPASNRAIELRLVMEAGSFLAGRTGREHGQIEALVRGFDMSLSTATRRRRSLAT